MVLGSMLAENNVKLTPGAALGLAVAAALTL